EGFTEYFVCCDSLRHQEHSFRGERERCCQGINLSHIGRLVHDKFKIGSAGIAEKMQDREVDATFIGHTGVRQFRRDVELMRQRGTLDFGERGETSGFDLNGKTCCPQGVQQRRNILFKRFATGDHDAARWELFDRVQNTLFLPERATTPSVFGIAPLTPQATSPQTDKRRSLATTGPFALNGVKNFRYL